MYILLDNVWGVEVAVRMTFTTKKPIYASIRIDASTPYAGTMFTTLFLSTKAYLLLSFPLRPTTGGFPKAEYRRHRLTKSNGMY